MKKRTHQLKQRAISFAIVGIMTAGSLVGAVTGCAKADVTKQPEETGTVTDSAEADVTKWSEETMKDGWNRVTNEGGKTLGYSPESGVALIEQDGYAFKDMNRNGQLDVYEDWRQDANNRAEDLASQLDADTILPLLFHHTLSEFDTEIGENDKALLDQGLRSAISRSSAYADKAKTAVKWSNNIQEYVESKDYAIPFNLSTDPTYMMNSPTNMALASTFDSEYIQNFFAEVAKQFRAVGVSTFLGPQCDIASEPRWSRWSGSLSEDPALSTDLTNAAVNGLQSTYDESGNDLGWGEDSVVAVTKHFPGSGTGEFGGDSHQASGKYNVYPGNSFETQLIPFFDGALQLTGVTTETAAIMPSYPISYSEDGSLGDEVGSAFSKFKIGLLRDNNYDGLIVTDWAAVTFSNYGMEDKTTAECIYESLEAGCDQMGGVFELDAMKEAYEMMKEDYGEEEALAKIRNSARRLFVTMFNSGIFENAYLDSEESAAIVNDAEALALGEDAQQKSVIMLKNNDNAIHAKDENGEKLTAYIPYVYRSVDGTWTLPIDLEVAGQYYNVVTDTLGEPTGEADKDGNPTYTENDLVRATAEELEECDLAIAFVNSPIGASSYFNNVDDDQPRPRTLQYSEYVADSDSVRKESIIKAFETQEIENPYGTTTAKTEVNLSYYGNSSKKIKNGSDLDTILYAAQNIPEDAKMIVSINASNTMVVAEFEEYVDAILINFGYSDKSEPTVSNKNVMEIISGNVEPSALLPTQIPASMDAVEAQYEDVPRDMECYVDVNGNTYDFGYGMNWSGVIQDERTEKYCVAVKTVADNNPMK